MFVYNSFIFCVDNDGVGARLRPLAAGVWPLALALA